MVRQAIVPKCLACLLVLASLAAGLATKPANQQSEIGSKKILMIFPLSAHSHQSVFSSLTNELLERGHYVTLVTGLLPSKKHPRLREMYIKDRSEELDHFDVEFFKEEQDIIEKTLELYDMGEVLIKEVFDDPRLEDLKKEKFDLVITETFFFQEAFLAFAHHFGCPSMTINSFGYSITMNELTGGCINPSYVTNVFSKVGSLDSYSDRFFNAMTSVFSMLSYHLYYYPKANALVHKVFPNAPSLYELLSNNTLTLINNNAALTYPVPLSPSVVEVGGIHIKRGKPLSADLKNWIEGAKDGIVYFSLGSILQAETLPLETQRAIVSALGKLKQRVLLKWNGEIPADAPANCRFEEWVPQQEVLAHPKLKVFVTHGGLLSTQESVYYGAPVIAMPVFGDQQLNARLATKKGFALTVSIFDFKSEDLEAALSEVINNPKYREQAKKLSVLFRSEPIAPLDKAVHYTELLMKLGTLKHLQPSSIHLRWYEYLCLDVAAVILVGLYALLRVLCFVRSICCGLGRKSKVKEE